MTINTRFLIFLTALLIAVGIFTFIACDTATEIHGALGGDDDDTIGDDDDEQSDLEAPDAPEVNAPRSPTSLTYQSVSGFAEPGSSVLIQGGTENKSGIADIETGAFCMRVDLLQNSVNQLEITAEDNAGNRSEATTITIEHESANVAPLGEATAASVSITMQDNTPDKAIDGDYNTLWSNTTTPGAPGANFKPQWLMIKLPEVENIHEINIYWKEDTIGTEFQLYYSQLENCTDLPHEYEDTWNTNWSNQWILLEDEPNNYTTNPISTFEYPDTPARFRWLLLVLLKSSTLHLTNYSFDIYEVELFSGQINEEDPGCE